MANHNWRRGLAGLAWLLALLTMTAGAAAQQAPHVDVLQIEGAVTPVMISYIQRGVTAAERDGAEALIIELNTPGGQIDLMNKVVETILAADVPVVVYVYPQGAFAASAGTLITLAGHVAAMAPGTRIGAASPVGSQGETLSSTEESKLKEDLKAQSRGLVARRGQRAVDWVQSAVDQAKAASAQEALDLGVIDYVATDLPNLLDQMDGRQVSVKDRAVTLHTAGVETRELPMTFVEQFLHVITNPTIAFMLLSLGPTAILFELSSPGGYAAGIFGAICLLLGFYAIGVLPVNYAGLLFIVLAFILFIADVKAPTHGVLTVSGVIALIAGGLILFNSPLYHVSLAAIVSVAGVIGLFFAFAVAKAVRAASWPVVTGREGLIGEVGQARTALDPQGTVFVHGELWQATAVDGPIQEGERVEVVEMEGFGVRVRRVAA
jgi:membrane-bound serine protease (ClpP class)